MLDYYKNINNKWELAIGISQNTWALPVQISIGYGDWYKRWGIGVRLFCITLALTKDYVGYSLIHGSHLPTE